MSEHGCHDALPTDSAGVPWAGRRLEENPFADDDGSAPAKLIEVLKRFTAGGLPESEVIAALSSERLLIPLLAVLGDSGVGPTGLTVDKSAELSIVTVKTPDGLEALPVFSSIAAMGAWNPDARPVPADGARVALAAASEGTARVVIDPGSDTEFIVRRTALQAVATGEPWVSPYEDQRVLAAFMEPASEIPAIRSLVLMPGDSAARLAGPEVLVQLDIMRGLDAADIKQITDVLVDRWAGDALIAERVDSLGVKLVSLS